MKRTCYVLVTVAGLASAQLVERVGSTGFIKVGAESFRDLTPKEQALAYRLTQASIAIDPIIYDQQSRFGLRQKHLLEAIASHSAGIDAAAWKVMARYKSLDLPTYWVGINSVLTAAFGPKGEVMRVELSYPKDVRDQFLRYAAMYDPKLTPAK